PARADVPLQRSVDVDLRRRDRTLRAVTYGRLPAAACGGRGADRAHRTTGEPPARDRARAQVDQALSAARRAAIRVVELARRTSERGLARAEAADRVASPERCPVRRQNLADGFPRGRAVLDAEFSVGMLLAYISY